MLLFHFRWNLQCDAKSISRGAVLWEHKTENWVEIHNLRLVKYGNTHHVDCDLVVPWYINVKDAHKESDILKEVVQEHYQESMDFTVHMDACFTGLCHQCGKRNCTERLYPNTDEHSWTVTNITSKHSVHSWKKD